MKTLLLAALLSAVILPPTAAAAPGQSPPRDGYVTGELIVRFEPGLEPAERRDALHDGGARLERTLAIPRTALVRGSGDALGALERDPRVASVERNVYRHGTARPDDAFFPWMWGLDNTGQAVGGEDGLSDADIDAPEAWDRTTGSADVKVAVLDSGIAFGQPDLAANLWRNPGESGGGRESNGVDDDGNGYVDDFRGWDFVGRDNEPSDNYGHGTHVAGTIAARGNDGVGVTGVAWRASIVPVRVLNNDNAGGCADLAEGMAYAVKAGARVVNVSIGSGYMCQLERDVIEGASNTLFVTSAGNDGQDVDQTPAYPCSLPSANVVCVAATDSRDRLPDWSNYGAQGVDLAAPGARVLSTIVRFEPEQVVYATGFENGLDSRWDTGGWPDTWQTTSQTWRRSGASSLSNSAIGWYVDNTDSWARLSLDMTPLRDCYAKVWRRHSLGPILPGVPGEAHDVIWAETSTDGTDWSHYSDGRIGSSSGFDPWWVELSELEGRATGSLRFRLAANAADTYGGVALDDLVVYCIPPVTTYTGAHEDNELYDGTSMAAPHVSGVAVLMLSRDPTLTAGELKQQLLATVDPLPSLAGKTVTGGRLNAARAVDLPPRPSGGAPGGATPPRPASLRSRMAAALEADLRAVTRRLRRRGPGRVRLNALSAGRFTLRLDSASGATVASGSCSRRRAGRCTLALRPTRRVRPVRRVTVELAFKPRSGRALVRRTRTTLPTRKASATSAAADAFSLTLAGPATGAVGQPMVIQASGKNPPPDEYWFPIWLSVTTIDSAVSPACPAYQPDAIQMSLATGGEWLAFTWREVVQADGSWSSSMGYTPKRPGRWLLCGYTHDNVNITRAAASLSVTVSAASAPVPPSSAGPPPPLARPANATAPRITRSGRRLVCDPGRWAGVTSGYTYRWSGGTRRRGRTLIVTPGLRGRTVRCSVTASNAAGTTTAVSRPRRVR